MVEEMVSTASFKNSKNPGRISLVFGSRKAGVTSKALCSIAPKLPEWLNMLKFIVGINVKSGHIGQKILAAKALKKNNPHSLTES